MALLPAGVISHSQVADLQQEVGRPVTWTALLTVKGYPYHEKVVERNDEARARGVEVWPQVSCRPLVFQMNLAEPFTLNSRPSFSQLMDLNRDERMAAYRDPAWRASTWEELSGGNGGGGLPFNWPSVSVAESTARPELVGRGVVELAGRVGLHAPRRHARRLPRRRARDPVPVGAGQRRRRGDRLAPAPGQRPARSGRLGGPRVAVVRRLLRHRPVGDVGARPAGDAARAGRPQADGGAGRRLRAGRPGDRRGGQGGRPLCLRPRDGGAGTAATVARLPGRRGTADGRRPGGDDPCARERGGHPGRQPTGGRGTRRPAGDGAAARDGDGDGQSGRQGVRPRRRRGLLPGRRAPRCATGCPGTAAREPTSFSGRS